MGIDGDWWGLMGMMGIHGDWWGFMGIDIKYGNLTEKTVVYFTFSFGRFQLICKKAQNRLILAPFYHLERNSPIWDFFSDK